MNKSTKIEMTPEAIRTFNVLKEELTNPPILGYADYTLPFDLHMDASVQGLGAVVYQEQQEQQSCALKPSELNYSAHKLEFLALKWAVCEKYQDYLYGHKFQRESHRTLGG